MIEPALAAGGALHALTEYAQFMLYKTVPSRSRPGKMDKFPVDPLTGDVVDAHNPAHWISAAQAVALAPMFGPNYGVAFVFTEADPFWFLDIDDCLLNGAWSPTAQMLMDRFFGAAIEVSQSGSGLHIFGRGQAPDVRKKKGEGFDLYTSGRVVALTGTHATGNAATEHGPALVQLTADFLTKTAEECAGWTTEAREDWYGPADDAVLLEKALQSRSVASAFGGKASFADLYNGNETVLAECYPPDQGGAGYDASRADAALAQHLAFWTGADCARIERLMRDSPMMREKWDRRPEYLEHTIEMAAAMQKAVYAAPRPLAELPPEQPPASLEPGQRSGIQLLCPERQRELFAGCVYLTDVNKIAAPDGQLLDQSRFNVLYGGFVYLLEQGTDKPKATDKAWDAFTGSRCLTWPRVAAMCFRPEEPPRGIITEEGLTLFNAYLPIQTKRIAGDARPFVELLEKLLPDARDRSILITYMAQLVRNPGAKFQWWPVLQGGEGNGKTLIIQAVEHAVGSRYSFMPNADQLADSKGKFNGWVKSTLFIGIEEIYVPHRRDFLESFKPWVTNRRLMVESKGVDQVMGDNRANGIMATNHKDGVPITLDGRRYCVLFTAQQNKADLARDGMTGAYFSNLYDWFYGRGKWAARGKDFGRAVINDWLRTCAIAEEFDPTGICSTAPSTTSTIGAVAASLGRVEQEVLNAIEEGEIGFRGGWVSSVFVDRLLEKMRVNLPVNKRRDMLQGIGFMPHPKLADGRVNAVVMPDGKKSRLYVRPGHLSANFVSAAEVASAYTAAQQPDPGNFQIAVK